MKKLIPLILVVSIVTGLCGVSYATDITQTYTDVPASHWAYDSIESCNTKGLIQGIGNNLFDPEAPLTRAHVVQLCYNAYYTKLSSRNLSTQSVNLADVPDWAWYSTAVNWAVGHGVSDISASDNYFRPEAPADRKFTALVLLRMVSRLGANPIGTIPQQTFPDVAELFDEYEFECAIEYVSAIHTFQMLGIINGFPDGTYRPHDFLTRAQAAKFFDELTNLDGMQVGPPPRPARPPSPTPTLPPNLPVFHGPDVWWTNATYQELLDYAATFEGITMHVEVNSNQVIIYIGAQWPVMHYDMMVFSNAGAWSTKYWYNRDSNTHYVFYDNFRLINFGYAQRSIETTAWQYDYGKDREPWISTSPDAKFPWE